MSGFDFADQGEWAEEVEMCWTLHKRSAWRMGDLVNWGIAQYTDGSKDSKADLCGLLSEQLEVSVKTLTNYAHIAQAFAEDERWAQLEIGHHELVIKLNSEERQRWLRRAAESGWSVKRMRVEMNAGSDPEEPVALPNLVAVEREFFRAGIRANLSSKRAKFQTGAGTLVLESDSDLRWGVI